MAQLLIRNLKPEIIERLKKRAKQHNRSLQGEAKLILETAAKITPEEARAAAEEWHKRLGGGDYSDSAQLIREDRQR